jgi:hypothetical protein
VIRCDQRCPVLEESQLFQSDRPIEVNVIEVEQWENARIGARTLKVTSNVGEFQVPRKRLRNDPRQPLVEVSKNNSMSGQQVSANDPAVKEQASLPAVLRQRSTEMHVEHVEHLRSQLDVGSETTSRFAAPNGNVVIAVTAYRETGENDVPVLSATVKASLSKGNVVPKLFGEKASLILLARAAVKPKYFLKGNNVGVDLRQNFRNSFGAHAPVQSPALMNVVGRDPKRNTGLSHRCNYTCGSLPRHTQNANIGRFFARHGNHQ